MSVSFAVADIEGFEMVPAADANQQDKEADSKSNEPGNEIADIVTYHTSE